LHFALTRPRRIAASVNGLFGWVESAQVTVAHPFAFEQQHLHKLPEAYALLPFRQKLG
jgi:hypothetical protein